jgi:hypothetical protein
MTQKEFIKVLDKKGYSYEMMGDSVVVNGGDSEGVVWLGSLTSISPGVVFNNGGHVDLRSLTSLPPGVEFKNGGDVNLDSLIGGYFTKWKGNIEGIDSERLLNKMIKDGVFER